MKISIVIPTKNRQSSLYRTIKSLNIQNFKNFEIIIIDQSEKINHKLKNNNNIKYFFEPTINSLVEAKKFSLKHVKTEYVGFLDDDVELDRNFINNLHNSIIKLKPIGISGTDNFAREKNIFVFILKKIFLIGNFSDDRIYFFDNNKLVKTNKLSGGYTFFKTEIFKKIGFREERLFHLNEDVDISWKIKKVFKENFYIDRSAKLIHHTKNTNTINIKDIDTVRKKIIDNVYTTLLLYNIHMNKFLNFIPLIWYFVGYFLLVFIISVKFRKLFFFKDFFIGILKFYKKKSLISY